MYVLMNESLATAEQAYAAGNVYDVDDDTARSWLGARLCAPSATPPPHIAAMLERLHVADGKPALFLPFGGEFGHLIMSHTRLIHFSQATRKVVCCKPGEEVLYPSADEFFTGWKDEIADRYRCGTGRQLGFQWPEIRALYPDHVAVPAGNLALDSELVAIEPTQRIPFEPKRRGMAADVVIGVRHREFCPEKNWPRANYEALAAAIVAAGHSFAVIGHRATSYDLPGQLHHSGDHDTDAAIELLQNCRLYVGSDTGSAHLAATVGAEMLVFREEARAHRNLIPRMAQVNAGRVDEMPAGTWSKPADVIRRTLEKLRTA